MLRLDNLEKIFFHRRRIIKVDIQWPSIVTPGPRDLITKLLQKVPNKRLPLAEVMRHPWIMEKMK